MIWSILAVVFLCGYMLGKLVSEHWIPSCSVRRSPGWWVATARWLNGKGHGNAKNPASAMWMALVDLRAVMRKYPGAWDN